MKRLIQQELEKFLSNSIIYTHPTKNNSNTTALIAENLITHTQLYFEKQIWQKGSDIERTTYSIGKVSSGTSIYKDPFISMFSNLDSDEERRMFESAYARYKEYFMKKQYNYTHTQLFELLLKNNQNTK